MKGKIIKTPKNATPTTRRTSRLFRFRFVFIRFQMAFKWLSNAVFNIIFGEKFVN